MLSCFINFIFNSFVISYWMYFVVIERKKKASYFAWRVYMGGEEIARPDGISATRYFAFLRRFIGQAISVSLFFINRYVISYQKVQKPDILFSRVTSAGQYIALHINTPSGCNKGYLIGTQTFNHGKVDCDSEEVCHFDKRVTNQSPSVNIYMPKVKHEFLENTSFAIFECNKRDLKIRNLFSVTFSKRLLKFTDRQIFFIFMFPTE